jgi:nucleoside-diphosphate-sugar epimerase
LKADQTYVLPGSIGTEAELEEVLTRPRPALVESIRGVASPLVLLGAGGKLGPTLAVLARRAAEAAAHPLEVIAVSRFTDGATRLWLAARGIRTLDCDLLAPGAAPALPDSQNVVYLVGLKFGTQQSPQRTWAINTVAPAVAAQRYPRAKLVVLSTGNVYPLTPVSRGGSVETDPLTPVGEYANAAVGRERIFEFYSERNGTPLALLRLNYAVELRYGVLVDIARKVQGGQPVEVTQGWFNCIWQGDVNEVTLRAFGLASSPPAVFNLTGPEVLSVRHVAQRFGQLLGKPVQIAGAEADTALLSNPARAGAVFGPPPTPMDSVMRWIAHWLEAGGPVWNRPTHFEVRDGGY